MDYSQANGYTKLGVEHLIVNTWQYSVSYYKFSDREFVAVIRDSANSVVHSRGDSALDRLSSWVNAQLLNNLIPNSNPSI